MPDPLNVPDPRSDGWWPLRCIPESRWIVSSWQLLCSVKRTDPAENSQRPAGTRKMPQRRMQSRRRGRPLAVRPSSRTGILTIPPLRHGKFPLESIGIRRLPGWSSTRRPMTAGFSSGQYRKCPPLRFSASPLPPARRERPRIGRRCRRIIGKETEPLLLCRRRPPFSIQPRPAQRRAGSAVQRKIAFSRICWAASCRRKRACAPARPARMPP